MLSLAMVSTLIMTESAPIDFEKTLEKLNAQVKRLESGELTLEEALKSFEEGVRLTRSCQEYLSAAEKRVEILSKTNGENSNPEFKPF